jgi:probable F420-dependent oxidoreductase
MAVGIIVPLPAYTLNPAFIASKAEALGFESIWYHEHPILPVDSASPFPATGGEIPWTYRHFSEPYISLAMAAAVTSKIKLATGITLVTEHNPLILAKAIAVLDLHSKGRFIFGVGAGWNREETTLMGGDFDHRWTQAREAVMALKALWTQEEAEFHGRYYNFPPVYCYPKPAQKPHPPVLLGGNAPNVLRRVARYADGWLPNRITPRQVEESRKRLDTLATEQGREPAAVCISVFGQPPDITRAQIEAFLNAGAVRVAVWPTHCETEQAMGEQLERMADTLIR